VLAYVHCATVAVNSVCSGEQRTCEMYHSMTEKQETSLALAYEIRYQAYSVTYFHSEIQDCPCTGAADVNGVSRQPTSRQNRRPEAADDAVIAKN